MDRGNIFVTSKSPSRVRRFVRAISRFLLLVVVLGILLVVGSGVYLVLSYRSWEEENSELIASFVDMPDDPTVVQMLDELSRSPAQRESIYFECDQIGILLGDVFVPNWESHGVDNIGVVCRDRDISVFSRFMGRYWLEYRLWQRVDGEMDFVLYDVRLGKVSISDVTFGWFNDEFNRGLKDALSVMEVSNFVGRSIEEIYLYDGGVRIISLLE